MLIDARTLASGVVLAPDVCIVGGGAAGITLARALDGAGLQVLLLESGGTREDLETNRLYEGPNLGVPYFNLETARCRFLGGTTNRWTGWCRPLDPADFAGRPWEPHSGWPISYDDLDPYYRLAHGVCELGDFDYDYHRWAAETASDLPRFADSGLDAALWQFSPPTRFGERYLSELESSANVDTLLWANAVALRARGRTVTEVHCATLSGVRFRVLPRVVVLAAGAIEVARLLLASDADAPRGLANGYDLVGRCFAEHPHANVGVLLSTEAPEALRMFVDIAAPVEPGPGKPAAVRCAFVLPEDVLERESLLPASFAIEPTATVMPPSAQLQDSVGTWFRRLGGGAEPHTHQIYVRSAQTVHPDSRITLQADRDALGMRRAGLDWVVDRQSEESVRRSLELFAQGLGRLGIGRLCSFVHQPGEPIPGTWPVIAGGFHHMGTTRMASDPRYGVVDSDCRAHELDNLYVASSAVFATPGYANPTLTIVALTLRLADHLKERFGTSVPKAKSAVG